MSDETGFLTRTDREFLTGEHEYTGENAKQQRYQRREAIAERTRQAFHDFALLYEVLDEHERDRIFDAPESQRREFRASLVDTVAFLYVVLKTDMELKESPIPDRTIRSSFDSILREGVTQAESDHSQGVSPLWTVATEFNVTVKDTHDDLAEERAIEKIAKRNHSKLTKDEMHALLLKYDSDLYDVLDVIPDNETPSGYGDLDERVAAVRKELDIPQQDASDEKIEATKDAIREVIEESDGVDE